MEGAEDLLTQFQKVSEMLRPGGLFVLEPGKWKSHVEKHSVSQTATMNSQDMKFLTLLLEAVGFQTLINFSSDTMILQKSKLSDAKKSVLPKSGIEQVNMAFSAASEKGGSSNKVLHEGDKMKEYSDCLQLETGKDGEENKQDILLDCATKIAKLVEAQEQQKVDKDAFNAMIDKLMAEISSRDNKIARMEGEMLQLKAQLENRVAEDNNDPMPQLSSWLRILNSMCDAPKIVQVTLVIMLILIGYSQLRSILN